MPSIVLFGDSITQGAWSAGDGPGAFRAPFNQSIITKSFIYSTATFLQQSNSLSSNTLVYILLLSRHPSGWAAMLAERYVRRADIINRGYSGYTTRWALQQLPHDFPAATPK